jgi:gamma-glutamylcyclotransferase (GGCT)/AIG2-like uncharacterized protein YtfP
MFWQHPLHTDELEHALALINSMDRAGWPEEALDILFDCPKTRLAAYGTLRPGESNASVLADVPGVWLEGTVQGVRYEAHGYPAFTWQLGEDTVPVSVLTSAALPAHWSRLDAFEGRSYSRILVPIRLPNGHNLVAYLYEYIGT